MAFTSRPPISAWRNSADNAVNAESLLIDFGSSSEIVSTVFPAKQGAVGCSFATSSANINWPISNPIENVSAGNLFDSSYDENMEGFRGGKYQNDANTVSQNTLNDNGCSHAGVEGGEKIVDKANVIIGADVNSCNSVKRHAEKKPLSSPDAPIENDFANISLSDAKQGYTHGSIAEEQKKLGKYYNAPEVASRYDSEVGAIDTGGNDCTAVKPISEFSGGVPLKSAPSPKALKARINDELKSPEETTTREDAHFSASSSSVDYEDFKKRSPTSSAASLKDSEEPDSYTSGSGPRLCGDKPVPVPSGRFAERVERGRYQGFEPRDRYQEREPRGYGRYQVRESEGGYKGRVLEGHFQDREFEGRYQSRDAQPHYTHSKPIPSYRGRSPGTNTHYTRRSPAPSRFEGRPNQRHQGYPGTETGTSAGRFKKITRINIPRELVMDFKEDGRSAGYCFKWLHNPENCVDEMCRFKHAYPEDLVKEFGLITETVRDYSVQQREPGSKGRLCTSFANKKSCRHGDACWYQHNMRVLINGRWTVEDARELVRGEYKTLGDMSRAEKERYGDGRHLSLDRE
ncbi:hypothetical protein RUND412_002023 [Rhizina undulata]